MRLTLRTLLAYLDDTLPGEEAKVIGHKVAESPAAQDLIEKIKRVTRRRGLSTPPNERGNGSDPNTVAEYLSDALAAGQLTEFENLCLESDVHLAEVAACHQILTLLLSEPVRVPPTARQRMYRLVSGPESLPNKKPGSAIPVGGIAPDDIPPGSDDDENAYLLGMKAYGRTESRNQRIGQLLLLSGLVAGLALTTYAAWPNGGTAEVPARQPVLAAIPKPAVEEPRAPAPEPKPFDPPAAPMPPAVEPVFADPPKPTPMVENPPAVELVPKPLPPKNDGMVATRFEIPERVLLVERDGRWTRVVPKTPEVSTGERLMALPGFHCPLALESGARIELWGNLPEQFPIPILESSVTLHAPDEGFDADLTLHSGRAYLTTKKPNGTTIRIRHGEEIWDVALADATTDVAVETTRRVAPGLTVDVDPSEKPQSTLQLAVLKGRAGLKVRHRNLPELVANDSVHWSSHGAGLQGPKRLPMGVAFARVPANATDAIPRAVQATLAEFAENFKDADSVRVRLAEMFVLREPGFNETPLETARRLVKPGVAVLAYSAIGDLPPAIDGLVDESRPRVRDAAAFGLQSLAASSPDAIDRIAKLLVDKSRLTAEQSRTVARLLRGPSPIERVDPKALDQLVELLNSPVLAIRELAFWQLVNEVDPESRSMKILAGFDAAATALAREGSFNAWKRRIDDLKKKLPEK
jgi:hypothetical protein